MNKIQAFGKNLLVQPVTKESIFSEEKPNFTGKCKVISVGKDVDGIKDGDVIIATYWASDECEDSETGEKLFFVLAESDYIKGIYETVSE